MKRVTVSHNTHSTQRCIVILVQSTQGRGVMLVQSVKLVHSTQGEDVMLVKSVKLVHSTEGKGVTLMNSVILVNSTQRGMCHISA